MLIIPSGVKIHMALGHTDMPIMWSRTLCGVAHCELRFSGHFELASLHIIPGLVSRDACGAAALRRGSDQRDQTSA
jgi:hypothetical protein